MNIIFNIEYYYNIHIEYDIQYKNILIKIEYNYYI